ncbi:MAG: helix-turn-helix domain-containing protein [bacterium]
MERHSRAGKGAARKRRAYDASGRLAQAARARACIVDVAEQMFFADGYAATTMVAIAASAGASVETIYKAFGGKAGLVRAIRDRRLAGQGPVHAEVRSNRARRAAGGARALVAEWGRLTAEVAPLVAPVLLLVRDAAVADPEMEALRAELDADRLRRMTANARTLRQLGYLRPGVTTREAADVLWTFSSPELYELLVLGRKWPLARYGDFVTGTLTSALLDVIVVDDSRT